MSEENLHSRVKTMLVESLMLKIKPQEIENDTPLFDPAGLGLDSIDALELAVALEKNFGIPTPSSEIARQAFRSVNTIVEFIKSNNK